GGGTTWCGRGGSGRGLGRTGGLAGSVDARFATLAPIPEGVDALTAPRTEPLAVTIRGLGRAGISTDSTVLVIGAGTIGLCAALAARDRAATVAITARHPHQRAAADTLGVTVLDESDLAAWGKEHRPDIVIESVGGTADTPNEALRVIRRGGRIVILGTFATPTEIDLQQMMMKEVSLIGSFCYGTGEREPEFTTAARMAGRWRDELRVLTTHQFPLDRVAEAFATADDKGTGAIKVTLTP